VDQSQEVTAGKGHLDRLARLLLIGGLVALVAAMFLTWAQLGSGGLGQREFFGDSTLFVSLLVQTLTVLAGASLTGAVFAYVMRAVRLDQ